MLRNKLNDLAHIVALPGDSRIVEYCYRNHKTFQKNQQEFKKGIRNTYGSSMFHMLGDDDWKLFIKADLRSATDVVRALGVAYAHSIQKPIHADTIIIDKSPNSMYYLDYIHANMGDCQIAYLYRDARDVVASLNTKPWATHNTLYNAKRWNLEQDLMRDQFDIEFSYDAFVRDPESVMEEFLQCIGYKNLSEVSEFIRSDQNKSRSLPETDASIHQGNHHKFLKHLSQIDREQEIIEFYCGENMERLGYSCFAENFDHRFYRKRFFLGLEFALNRFIKIVKREEEY